MCIGRGRLARAGGLAEPAASDVLYAALLQHIGCTAYSHEVSALFANETSIKQARLATDFTRQREVIFGYLPRVTREAPPGDRLRTIRSALLHSGQMTDGATDVLDEGTGEFQGVPATGRPVRFAVMAVLRFADGQAVEHWDSSISATLWPS